MLQTDQIHEIGFESYPVSISQLLDSANAGQIFENQSFIMLKPDLVNDSAFPVTTAVECCRAVIEYIKDTSHPRIVIAEGCGDAVLDTWQVFSNLGYTDLIKEFDIELIDLQLACWGSTCYRLVISTQILTPS